MATVTVTETGYTLDLDYPPVLYPALEPSRYKALYGGRGSMKSHFFAEQLIKRCITVFGTRWVCIREVQKSLKQSSKLLLEDKISEFQLDGDFKSTDDRIITPGGGVILFQGMQDHTADSIKSLEGFDGAWSAESQTISKRSLEYLKPTIRKARSELWFDWNPRNADDPVDKLFRGLEPPQDSIIIRLSYKDNPWFPGVLEQERIYDERNNPERYAHIWLGEYEPTAIGAIWDRVTLHNTRRNEAPDIKRIVVAVDPAVSSEEGANNHGIIVAGLGSDRRAYILEDGTTRGGPSDWANRAINLYDKWGADCIVSEINQGGDMVKHTLETVRPAIPVIEVRATRGKHVRAEPIASLYKFGKISHVGTFPELENEMCQMTAAGYEGKGSPDRCLIAGTAIETETGPVPIEKVKPGDRVWTRKGLRRVSASEQTAKLASIMTVEFSSGVKLSGTKNHPVYVNDHGFLAIDAIVWGDRINHIQDNALWQKEKAYGLTGLNMSDTPIARVNQPGGISTKIAEGQEVRKRYIDKYGNIPMGQSLRASTSTILMVIRLITKSRIFKWLRQKSTRKITRGYAATNNAGYGLNILIESARLRQIGIEVRKAVNGIVRMGNALGKTVNQLGGNVLNVAWNTAPHQNAIQTGFAHDFVLVGTTRGQNDITKQEHVSFAEQNSRLRRVNYKKSAPVHVVGLYEEGEKKPTFNLAVEGENEYYANGVLVHNCDALVWACTELFPDLIRNPQPKVHVQQRSLPGGWMG